MMADVVCDRNFPCTALHDKSWLVAIVEERSFGTFHEPSQDTRASSWSLALLTHSRSPFYDLPSRVRQPSFLSPSQASFRRLLPFAFLLSVVWVLIVSIMIWRAPAGGQPAAQTQM